jgi:Xaa-Pro aminopeptidase
MRLSSIPTALFQRNRAKLIELMEPGSVALVGSSSRKIRNADQFYPYRQHSDFYYLTGINQEESVLFLFADRRQDCVREILFIRKPTPKSLLWSGPGLTLKEAGDLSGIEEVQWLEGFDATLGKLLPHRAVFYTAGDVPLSRITEQYPDLRLSSMGELMIRLRRVKEPEELEAIRTACHITRSAFGKILSIIQPGIWEYEIEAEIIAEFIRRGSSGHAYEPIVASGKNALTLHYVANKDRCRDGDLVLIDFGAEVNNYASDCSRTIPVNGRFTPRQRQVYEAVLRVFRKAQKLMMPGVVMADFHNQVGELFQEEHIGLGLYSLKEAEQKSGEEPLWKRYYMHGTSHSMGLDVHDPCDRTTPFEPGMVLTCEPAIYIKEEGLGIRLENDMLITAQGAVDLMEHIPIEADEIEELIHAE